MEWEIEKDPERDSGPEFCDMLYCDAIQFCEK